MMMSRGLRPKASAKRQPQPAPGPPRTPVKAMPAQPPRSGPPLKRAKH